MVQIISANDLELGDVEKLFNLQYVQYVQGADFFSEWQQPLSQPELTEIAWIDRMKADFLGLIKHPPYEEIVKMFALAPLLIMAGLSRPPFIPRAEYQVKIAFEDNELYSVLGILKALRDRVLASC